MAQFSLLRAEVLVLFIESLLFGAHCILYSISVWILIYRRRRWPSSLNLWMFGIVTLMCALACVHLGLDVAHFMVAFVDHGSGPGGPLAYYEHQGNVPSYVISPVLFALLTLVGDAFMTYRIFVVWRRKVISLALPLLLIVGDLVAAGFTGHELYKSPGSIPSGLLAPAVYRPMIAYFVMTLLTNIGTTFLLLARILWYDREMRSVFQSQDRSSSVHWQVMKTIMQSEAIYSLAVVVNLILYAIGSNAVYITFAALPPLVGISFTMIIARIGLSEVLDDSRNGSAQSGDLSTLRATRARARASIGTECGPAPIGVYVSTNIEWRNGDADGSMDDGLQKTSDTVPEGGIIHLRPLQRC
ncbi:hypothetical protein GY45DRAFT_1325657 [Cubamyces sp. BRFM 1775]|nr:hypothetical protein GY45DRAFT_1325657 [Cubamyces sp. BRFM 1775]